MVVAPEMNTLRKTSRKPAEILVGLVTAAILSGCFYACNRGPRYEPGIRTDDYKHFRVIAARGLNLRAQPGIKARKISALPYLTTGPIELITRKVIDLQGRRGFWLKTSYKGQTGWIFSGFVLLARTPEELTSIYKARFSRVQREKDEAHEKARYFHVRSAGSQLRAEPRKISARIAVLPGHFRGPILERLTDPRTNDGWYKTKFADKEGWISRAAVLPIVPRQTSRRGPRTLTGNLGEGPKSLYEYLIDMPASRLEAMNREEVEARRKARFAQLMESSINLQPRPPKFTVKNMRAGGYEIRETSADKLQTCGGPVRLISFRNIGRGSFHLTDQNVVLASKPKPDDYFLLIQRTIMPCSCAQSTFIYPLFLLKQGLLEVAMPVSASGPDCGFDESPGSSLVRTRHDSARRILYRYSAEPHCVRKRNKLRQGPPGDEPDYDAYIMAGLTGERFIVIQYNRRRVTRLDYFNQGIPLEHIQGWEKAAPF